MKHMPRTRRTEQMDIRSDTFAKVVRQVKVRNFNITKVQSNRIDWTFYSLDDFYLKLIHESGLWNRSATHTYIVKLRCQCNGIHDHRSDLIVVYDVQNFYF